MEKETNWFLIGGRHVEHLGSPPGFGGVRDANFHSFLFCVFALLSSSLSCVPNVVIDAELSILDCPFGFL
jgi:hypothetical protein